MKLGTEEVKEEVKEKEELAVSPKLAEDKILVPKDKESQYILPKDIRDLLETGTFTAELIEKENTDVKQIGKTEDTKIKIEKNYLTSKEAFELIINNYASISFKPEIINYVIDFLKERYIAGDISYVDKYLFKEDLTNKEVQEDLIKKILHNKKDLLFDYYFRRIFTDVHPESLGYTNKIKNTIAINSSLVPKDLREYYAINLQKMLLSMTPFQIEDFYKEAQKEFTVLPNTYFTIDLFSNFIIPALQNKIKDMSIDSYYDLKKACTFINKYPDLKYSRYSRILLTSYELLNTKGGYLSYDQDIVYDAQEIVGNILLHDKILDYNLVHFCSYFDGKIDFGKSLNMIINILEGTNTIALSRIKYEQIKDKTVYESLNFLQWLLDNYSNQTKTPNFDNAVYDFLTYNWDLFTESNKSFITMKTMLSNYEKLDETISRVKKVRTRGFTHWYSKNGPFVFASLITLVLFIGGCYFGVMFISSMINNVITATTLVTLILIEIVVIAMLIIMMMLEKNER